MKEQRSFFFYIGHSETEEAKNIHHWNQITNERELNCARGLIGYVRIVLIKGWESYVSAEKIAETAECIKTNITPGEIEIGDSAEKPQGETQCYLRTKLFFEKIGTRYTGF